MTDVHAFWEKQAEDHGASDLATAPDHFYRELEINRIKEVIGGLPHRSILDVGCGNGYSTIDIGLTFPEAKMTGIDYSAQMIMAAQAANQPIDFWVGDVRTMALPQRFDLVLSERCLINLPNWDEQREGLRRMRDHLNVDGHLVLVENFKGGLARLNRLRASLDLPPIAERWHNSYLPDDEFEAFIADRRNGFNIRRRENIGNLYYILSRVLYAKLAADAGAEPRYDHPINEIAAKLPSLGSYAYSPNYLMVLGVR